MVNDDHTQRPWRVHQISRTIAVKKGCGLKEKVKLHALSRSRMPPVPPPPPPSDEIEPEVTVVAPAPPPPPPSDEKRALLFDEMEVAKVVPPAPPTSSAV